MDFSSKKVIVTGGATGIGRAVAEGIVDGGGTVIIADLNLEAARKTQGELGSAALVYQMDLGNTPQVREVIAQIIADVGRIHGVVNNAGVISTKPFADIHQAEWDRVIQVNLNGTFAVISALFPHMQEKGGGRIVNVSSIASKVGGGILGTAAYATSKAGINGLTKAVAKEGGKYNISCNAVCPGYTNTGMTSALREDHQREQRVLSMVPLGRRAEPQEIANMILFFASDLAGFVNGEIGDVDGGLTLDG